MTDDNQSTGTSLSDESMRCLADGFRQLATAARTAVAAFDRFVVADHSDLA